MNKRKATEDSNTAGAVVLRGSKRTCIQDPVPSEFELELDDEYEYDTASETYTATAASTLAADTPLTPLSPARKFPSEFKTIKCTFPGCSKAYNRPARLAAHLRSHANDRPFRCTYPDCDKSYIEEKHLKQHIKGSHTNERAHICAEPGCGKSFLTATRLRRHQAVHEGQERFRCRDFPPCNQSFRKHQTLQRHIRSDHLKVSPFPCTFHDDETGTTCSAGFENSGALRRHQEREHGELKFWCDECNKDDNPAAPRVGFPSLALLQTHMKNSHVSCMFCGTMCTGRESLEEHIEAEHSAQRTGAGGAGSKRVTCTWQGCKKTFAKQANLNVHVRSVHEGHKFTCGQVDLSSTPDLALWPQSDGCGEFFTTKANLENHVRFVHLKFQRPEKERNKEVGPPLLDALSGAGRNFRYTIACQVQGCTFKFATAGELNDHMVTEHFAPVPGFDDGLLVDLEPHKLGHDDTNLDLPNSDMNTTSNNVPAYWDDEDTKLNLDDTFWYGGDTSGPDFSGPAYEEEWMRDEAEMRALIGSTGVSGANTPAVNTPAACHGDENEGLGGLVDPALETL